MVQAVQQGAAPYLSPEDRVAFGVTRSSGLMAQHDHVQTHMGGALKFMAYEKAAPPPPKAAAAIMDPFAGAGTVARCKCKAVGNGQRCAVSPAGRTPTLVGLNPP
jgi:hypothetical protein